jgi:hypothetical protein
MEKRCEARSICKPRRFLGACEFQRFLHRACASLALCLLFSFSPFLLFSLSSIHGEEEEEVPMFRRLLLSAERLPQELKRVQGGVLVRLPVAEFDALVERAKRARTRKLPPQLLETRYHATLKDDSLIGEGQWKLVHSGPGPGLLNVQPFNLALRQARFENGDALIAAFDGKTPALLVEKAGERTVSLDWSARAESGPEGLQFHLEMPSCPVALFELDVPAGRTVSVLNDGALLSGPHEAERADFRRWKIVCGGRQRVDRQRIDIRIHQAARPDAGSESAPAPFVHQKTTQKLHPEGLEATFELALDSPSRGIRELVCECDAELRLRAVVGPGVEGYSFQAADPSKPARLTIRLREPARAGTWQILCLAPLNRSSSIGSQSIAWRSPGLKLVNSVPRGETLTLWLHPDLRVENWVSGDYRLLSSDIDRATGAQIVTLAGGGLGPPHRPSARLQAYGVEFSTQQLTWWRCHAGGMALTVQIGWDVSQGQLFQLQVLLPAEWEVEKVEMAPSPLLSSWHVLKAAGKATLFVDLASPLGPAQRSKSDVRNPKSESGSNTPDFSRRLPALTVQLRPAGSGPITGKWLLFPDAVPLGARFREGALALDCDEQLFHLQVKTAAERTEPEGEGPWGQQLPEYYYRYSDQPAPGKILVRSRPPRLRAKCASDVLVAGGEAIIDAHLSLEAEAGNPNTVELSLSSGDGGAWQWRTEASPRGDELAANRVRRVERVYSNEISCALHFLAVSHPLQAAIVEAARPAGERWRLTLARPLRLREPLRLHARRRLQRHGNRWDVPLPVVLGAERMEGEVVLHLAGAGLVPVQSVGLQEAASTTEQGATPWRALHYGQNGVSLTLSGEARALAHSRVASIGDARLITYVGDNGILRHYFSFQVANWGEHTLPVRLPPGSQPLAIQVNGRWLPQLVPSSQTPPENETMGPVELALPVPSRALAVSAEEGNRFEIVYVRKAPIGFLWQTIDAPLPQLPIAPIGPHRLWRLPPRLTPLLQGRYQCVPGTASEDGLAVLPRHVEDLFHLPGSWAHSDPLLEDPHTRAIAALRQAAQELRNRHADQKTSLGEVVNEMAFLLPKRSVGTHPYPLIIDALALREAGVGAETRLTIRRPSSDETPPWAECGLTAVSARSAILLTTKSGRGAPLRGPLSETVENAVAEAAQYGQDASGRFHSALSWLHPETVAGSVGSGPPTPNFEYEGGEWSEWEPIAGVSDERLIVVRRDGVTAVGSALGLMFALLLALPRQRSGGRRLRLLLLALAFFGLGVLWLPSALRDLAWWPFMATGAVAVLVYLGALVPKPASPPSTPGQPKNAASAAAVASMLVLGFLGWNGRADAPAPATVYLVPASADAPDKPTLLAPADLLERLKALAQPAPLAPGGPQTVLVDASYEGQLVEEGKQAEFAAVFFAHSLSDGPSKLIVPLAGVQLVGEVLLDGARTAPVAAPQAGYSLLVRGRGRHKIELSFRVPVVGTAEDRNVMFTAPPLMRSRLSWHVPAGAVESKALVKNGAQWATGEGDGQRLEADLGALPLPVHLHWYQPGRPTRVSYQAAYLWDLGLEANYLTAWLRYRVEQGAIKTLDVDLPAELEVSTANAQRALSLSRPPWRTRFQLRDWHITRVGNKRVLRLELPYPVSGDFQVTLELLPHAPLTSQAALPLPSPRDIPPGGPHFLAYRTQPGLNAQRDTSQNLTRIDSKEFAPNWLGGPSLGADFQGIAYRIPPNRPPQLILRLERKSPLVQGDVDITVRASAQRAEMEALADVTAPNKDLAAIEWELPPRCLLASVSGDEVRTWKQNGSRLLVWLNRTTARTRIHLNGWLPLSLRDGHPHLELNGPRLLHADKQHTRLRLAASGDLVLASLRTQNLQPLKTESPANPGRSPASVFETGNLSYRLECQVQRAANAVARVLTLAEASKRELRFTTTVHYTVTHGQLRQVRLRLRNWEEEKVEVQAERVALWREPQRTMGERSWLLPLQAGVQGEYQVTLHGSMPLDKAAGGVLMPEVLVQGVEHADYFLAVLGGELTGQAKGSLQSLKAESQGTIAEITGAKFGALLTALVKKGGQVWRISDSEWQVRLLPQTPQLQPTPIRIYLLEQSAAVVGDRRWLHEARFWLRHDGQASVTVDFAEPARVLAASVDALEAKPRAETRSLKSELDNRIMDYGFRISDLNNRVWLPLPGQPGVRCVRLRWMYDSPEPLDRPNLTPPQLSGAVPGPVLWTLIVPLGWQASLEGVSGRQGTSRETERALWRADAQLRIRQDLARERQESVASADLAAQQRFDLYCRLARRALDQYPDVGDSVGPQGQSLADWLEDLQAKNRILKTDVRNPQSETPVSDSDVGMRMSDFEVVGGIPVFWQTLPDAKPWKLQLTPEERHQIRQALIASVEWLGALAVVWILSLLPFLRRRLHLFWPEQIALLGILGWHWAGLTSIVLGLLFMAACSRVFLLIRGLRTFVREQRRQPSTMTAGNGVVS